MIVALWTCLASQASWAQPIVGQSGNIDLQLEVFINDLPRRLIASFALKADGTMSMAPDQLRNIGLSPVRSAIAPDGMVMLERLPGVTYIYDPAAQTIHFTATPDAQAPQLINARPVDKADRNPVSGTGALMNYTLFGNWRSDRLPAWPNYQGVSGYVDSRLFSNYGMVSNSFVAGTGASSGMSDFTRLESRWSYSDPKSLRTYIAGDLISRGPGWSRPIRMGGLQLRSNFALRPDLITMPIPSLSGTAAVPSTIDVLVNNSRVYSGDVGGGPFQVNNLPVVSGAGTARVVIRDALGRETIQDVPYYASSSLLAAGLTDYSVEAGFARKSFGLESDAYDRRPMGSASARRGISDTFTLETHIESGPKLVNGGIGAVVALGAIGTGSMSLAGSDFHNATGYLAAASVEMRLRSWTVYLRSQRTFRDYADLASIPVSDLRGAIDPFQSQVRPPRALDQLSLSIPISFDKASLNFTLSHLQTVSNAVSRIAGLSYNRPVWGDGSFFVTGYKDFDRSSYGLFAGITMPFGERLSTSLAVQSSGAGSGVVAEAVRPITTEVNDYGWRVRLAEGKGLRDGAAASYRLPVARVEAGVVGGRDAQGSQLFAQADGSVVVMDRDIFFANRIDDAFAVVDAGLPGVEVRHQNRRIGTTGTTGKILVPTLQSWDVNEISIDPAQLPLDVDLGNIRKTIVPTERSGVTVKFGAKRTQTAALIVLRDGKGAFVEAGSIVRRQGSETGFIVGYDGEAFLENLQSDNAVVVERKSGETCRATFAFRPQSGELVKIDGVLCQ